MLARKDVSAETKQRLRATCAELDMTTLLHEIFLPPRMLLYPRGVLVRNN